MIHRRLQFQQQFKGKKSSFQKKKKCRCGFAEKHSVLFTERLQNLILIYKENARTEM